MLPEKIKVGESRNSLLTLQRAYSSYQFLLTVSRAGGKQGAVRLVFPFMAKFA